MLDSGKAGKVSVRFAFFQGVEIPNFQGIEIQERPCETFGFVVKLGSSGFGMGQYSVFVIIPATVNG